MATKTINSSTTSRGYWLSLDMEERSQSIENNTTTIYWELRIHAGNSWHFSSYGIGWEVYINGTRVGYHDRNTSDRYSVALNSYTVLQSGTTVVTHDNDGTKTVACSASIDMSLNPAGAGPMSLSGSWTLTTIPRASSLTIPTLTIGQEASLTITAASTSFTHNITYSLGSVSGSISAAAGVTSVSWTPPTSLYPLIPNATSASISISIETFSGSTSIGIKTYSVPVNVGTDIRPTAPIVTLSPVNTNAWLNSQGLYVGGYTRVRIQSSASPGTGATIATYTISGAATGSGADVTSAVLDEGAKSITVTVTDSRGRSNSTTVSVTFLPYSPPALSMSAERGTWNGAWTADVNGDHIRVLISPSVSLASQGNTGTVTATAEGVSPDVVSGSYYIWTSTNATTTYAITARVVDKVGQSSTKTVSVLTVEVPFNVDVDLPGAAFGMIAQTARIVEIPITWQLKIGGVLIPDPNEAGKVLAMKSDGTGLEWITP